MCYEQKHKEEPLQALPCDRNQDIEEEVDPDLVDTINYALRWKEVKKGSTHASSRGIEFTTETCYAEEANLGKHVLN